MKAGRWPMLVQTNQATAQNQSNMSVSQAPRAAAPRRAMLVFCSTAAFRRRVLVLGANGFIGSHVASPL